jgi:uncharacterized protein (TIGR02246 family)
MVTPDPETARAIVEAAHHAWNSGDIEGMLASYTEDVTYVSNTGPNGESMTLRGKAEFRARFEPILSIVRAVTSLESFYLEGSVARIRYQTYVLHHATGHEMTGTYRQLCTYRGLQICRIEDFHDAAKIAAFWRLIEASL